jgi:hypothetical protein
MTPVIDLYMLVLTLIATGQCIKHEYMNIFLSQLGLKKKYQSFVQRVVLYCEKCGSLVNGMTKNMFNIIFRTSKDY